MRTSCSAYTLTSSLVKMDMLPPSATAPTLTRDVGKSSDGQTSAVLTYAFASVGHADSSCGSAEDREARFFPVHFADVVAVRARVVGDDEGVLLRPSMANVLCDLAMTVASSSAIRNFKAHFLSILAGVADDFPMQLWDKLLPHF